MTGQVIVPLDIRILVSLFMASSIVTYMDKSLHIKCPGQFHSTTTLNLALIRHSMSMV